MMLQHTQIGERPILGLKINAPEIRNYVRNIPKLKDQLFDLMRVDFKAMAVDFLNGLFFTHPN
jgi:hypothetical protein